MKFAIFFESLGNLGIGRAVVLFNRCPLACFRLNSKLVSIGHFAVSRKTGSVLYRIAPGENWVKIRPPNQSHPKDYGPKLHATLRRPITRSLLT